jgi:voltage-gated potassium channel
MFVAALLVVPVVVLDASHTGHGWKTFALILNWLIWVAFAAELVTMLRVSPDRLGWLRQHPLEAAIVVLTPPFLPATLQALRFFRLLRLLRIVVVAKKARQLLTVDGVRFAAVLAGVAALGGGAIFANVEKQESLWDGVWWAVTTMATVGYGDLSPTTVIGRLDAIVLMFIGIGFFALVTGAVAQKFVAADVHTEAETLEAAVHADVDLARDEIAIELRAIAQRLNELEQKLNMR